VEFAERLAAGPEGPRSARIASPSRLHFDGEKQNHRRLFDAHEAETRHPIASLDEIYAHADAIRESIRSHAGEAVSAQLRRALSCSRRSGTAAGLNAGGRTPTSEGAPGGTRTPNPFLRTELLFH
jgi:hypothetical protein